MEVNPHKAGFVSIIGLPNAGKSTLLNALLTEKISIISHKVQTTRQRVTGIINGDHYQIVLADTPGIIEPRYELQKAMMRHVNMAMDDADLIVYVHDIQNKPEDEEGILKRISTLGIPTIVLINKIDLSNQKLLEERVSTLSSLIAAERVMPVSAKEMFNVSGILEIILEKIPEHPAYFPKDELSDKSERFFASEFIREQVFLLCDKEIPYSTEVVITGFKDKPTALHIQSEIIVERDSQKGILIGKQGGMLKKIGTRARQEMERFFGRKVFLEQHVRVDPDWRKSEYKLARYGYK